jgi:hypothetical protein
MLSFLEDEEDSHLYVDVDPESVVLSVFFFFLIVGIRTSLRVSRLISRDLEVNNHVNFQ